MIGGLAFGMGSCGSGRRRRSRRRTLIGAVASAFESDPASEAEFIAQVARRERRPERRARWSRATLGRAQTAPRRVAPCRRERPAVERRCCRRAARAAGRALRPAHPAPAEAARRTRGVRDRAGPSRDGARRISTRRNGPPSSGSAPTPRHGIRASPAQPPPTLRSGAPPCRTSNSASGWRGTSCDAARGRQGGTDQLVRRLRGRARGGARSGSGRTRRLRCSPASQYGAQFRSEADAARNAGGG